MWLGSPLRTIGSISQVKFTESRSTIRPRRSPTVPTAQRCWCCRWAFSLATSCGERRSSPRWNAGLPGTPLLSGAQRVLVICHRGRHCARAAGAGHIRHPDGVRDHVRRVDAGPCDCVRAGRSSQDPARGAVPHEKKRDTDAAPHLWLDGHNCQPPTPNSQTLSRVVVGSWESSVVS